ncbi:hypothetical protein SKAU_G00269800 [Synaphobranchus kaupii]|uniref:Uncharacterized protein n=1 Tax=Synaphobranchus kaupii TaxID=118154 RepID=A0A9Q1IQG8_SYNKA|nr:hypothetical protein SKAU_G00269800 [Synaphobranchus kaupii]
MKRCCDSAQEVPHTRAPPHRRRLFYRPQPSRLPDLEPWPDGTSGALHRLLGRKNDPGSCEKEPSSTQFSPILSKWNMSM